MPAGDETLLRQALLPSPGRPAGQDALVFEQPDEREIVFGVEITRRRPRVVVITAFKGSSDKSEVYLMDRCAARVDAGAAVHRVRAAYAFIEARRTRSGRASSSAPTSDAPRGAIVAVDLPSTARCRVRWSPSRRTSSSRRARHPRARSSLSYSQNASDRIRLFDLDGKPAGDSRRCRRSARSSGISGRPEDDEMFVGFTSFTYPPANYRYDFAAKAARRRSARSAATDRPGRRTRRHRSGIRRRTARRCRCSWCTARDCRWTATGRCC